MLKPIISPWLKSKDPVSHTASQKPYTVVYPLDYFPVANRVQMKLIDVFLSNLAKTLDAQIRKVSIASLWEMSLPAEAGAQNVHDYLEDTYVHTNFHDYYYYNTNDFRDQYQAQYHRRPYVIPFVSWKWELGKAVTKPQRDDGMKRLEIYKNWFVDHFLRQETDQALLIMPISNVTVNYRDIPPAPVTRPTGFDPVLVAPILAPPPDIVVPIGEYEHEPRVSGNKEHLPVGSTKSDCPAQTSASSMPFNVVSLNQVDRLKFKRVPGCSTSRITEYISQNFGGG